MVCKSFFSVLLALFGCVVLYATGDDISDPIIAIDEVVVKTNRLDDFGIGLTIQKLDSFKLKLYRSQSLSDLLAGGTAFSVKSYGPAGLSSITVRGGGTRHTALLWNGLNLQSPMNATFNFSTIPVSFIDEINVQYGGSGTLFGSGATSGAIHIDNSLKLNQPALIESGGSVGSFETYNQIAKVIYSTKSFATAIRFSHRAGANNFTFVNDQKINHPLDTLKNASYEGYSFMQQNTVRIAANSLVRADFWYQKYNKRVPSLMSDMLPGKDKQTDENFRISVNSSQTLARFHIDTRIGLLNDKVIFNDANNHSLSIISETEVKYILANKHKFNIGINYTYETANSEGYTDSPNRNRTAIFGSYSVSMWNHRIISVLNFREERVDTRLIPFVYSFATKVESFRGLYLKGNISRNYSLPTFNDLYWRKSIGVEGNPDLKPESGFSIEGGMEYILHTDQILLNSEASVFKSEIENWIIWLPNDQGIWKPGNFEKGISKGVDLKSDLSLKLAEFIIRIGGIYTYTIAKPIKTGMETSDYEGGQMIYVPKNKMTGNLFVGWKAINICYSHSYTDQRYTSPGQTLKRYQLGEASVSNDWHWKKYSINLYFKVDNLWNTSYQLTKGYAMPGISYTCGLNFKLNSK